MSMNFYAVIGKTEIHIGKQSFGWNFDFNSDGGRLRTLAAWVNFLSQSTVRITDEGLSGSYTLAEFLQRIVLHGRKDELTEYGQHPYGKEKWHSDGLTFCDYEFS